jgi:hypothetical protein
MMRPDQGRKAAPGPLYPAVVKARLTVTVERSDFLEIRRAASLRRLSVSQWIRQALRAELERERAVAKKLKAIRRAAKCSFPTGDIEQMLAEIGSGYL